MDSKVDVSAAPGQLRRSALPSKTQGSCLTKMTVSYLAIIIALAVGVVIGWLLVRSRKRSTAYDRALSNIRRVSPAEPSNYVASPKPPVERSRREVIASSEATYVLDLRAKLKQKALGNETVVERLIQYERTRNPNGHMELWVQAAIDRWEHDNRSHR
jgi:hypothetical protein